MTLYRCVVKCGHVGSGKYTERAVYIKARNATEAFQKAKNHRGVKKGCLFRNGASVINVDKAV